MFAIEAVARLSHLSRSSSVYEDPVSEQYKVMVVEVSFPQRDLTHIFPWAVLLGVCHTGE